MDAMTYVGRKEKAEKPRKRVAIKLLDFPEQGNTCDLSEVCHGCLEEFGKTHLLASPHIA
jgi:hypothetical protein